MPKIRLFCLLIIYLAGSFAPLCGFAQPDYIIPLNKPQKYKEKTLRSEKSEDMKFTIPRKVYQGMVTHYNYYYNANLKMENILERAKIAHRDDFTELLPFYNYSTDLTAADSTELDSIIYKASAGIVLHDLRNSYIYNLYMLVGRAYFHWGKLDSAYRIFQFVNYRFFPKSKDEYNIVVGSNSRNTKGELNISTKEKRGIIRRIFSKPPSRNEALLWIAKTYAADSLYPEAISLCHLLKRDKYFPKRLYSSLDEVLAFVFYQQEQWDSTTYYLKKSLRNCTNKTDLSRWEYLLAQLYTKLKKNNEASYYYARSKKHTPDPVLYIHARIYEAQIVKNSKGNDTETTFNELLKLSRKERFDGFEDVLYYAAAGIAIERKDTIKAIELLNKSAKYNTENTELKNKTYLKLADYYYQQKKYYLSSASYDSLNTQDPILADKINEIETRKKILKELVVHIDIVNREDSLQRIALLSEKERYQVLKKILRALRKEKGIRDTDGNNGNTTIAASTANSSNLDQGLFLQTSASTGSWYFNNNSQKAKGFNDFKSRWGKRPNLDNWRRQSDIDAANTQQNFMPGNPGGIDGDIDQPTTVGLNTQPQAADEQELSIESLESNLPLTEDSLKASNNRIVEALLQQAFIYKNQLEDYRQATFILEEILKRFPTIDKEDSILSALIYTSKKSGDQTRSANYNRTLKEKYPDYKPSVSNQQMPEKDRAKENLPYEKIYALFKIGNYAEAMEAKKKADSIYGNIYWTPHLLYLEALGYLHLQEDSLALKNLNYIETQYSGNEITGKAAILKDVIIRKKETISILQQANIQKEEEKILEIPYEDRPVLNPIKDVKRIYSFKLPAIMNYPLIHTTLKRPPSGIEPVSHLIDVKSRLPFDGFIKKTPPVRSELKPLKEERIDMVYVYNPNETYLVLMVFEQIDQVYRNEARIAFQRYNNASRGGQDIFLKLYEPKDEMNWLEIGPFATLGSSMGYYDEIAPNMSKITPWLASSKYQLLIISENNLEMLKTRKDLSEYLLFIRQYVKGKF